MDTQHCLQCELHKDKRDQDGCKYCYCFFNPDKGRWIAEIETCPKLGKQISGSSEIPNDLKEAADEYERTRNDLDARSDNEVVRRAFIAGAKWQAEHQPLPEDTVLFNKGVEEGKRLMIEEAVEGIVTTRSMAGNIVTAHLDWSYKDGQKVRMIIIKKED